MYAQSKVYLTPHLIVDSYAPDDCITFSYLHTCLANEKLAESILEHFLGNKPTVVFVELPAFSDFEPFRQDSAYRRCAASLMKNLQRLSPCGTHLTIATLPESSFLKFWDLRNSVHFGLSRSLGPAVGQASGVSVRNWSWFTTSPDLHDCLPQCRSFQAAWSTINQVCAALEPSGTSPEIITRSGNEGGGGGGGGICLCWIYLWGNSY